MKTSLKFLWVSLMTFFITLNPAHAQEISMEQLLSYNSGDEINLPVAKVNFRTTIGITPCEISNLFFVDRFKPHFILTKPRKFDQTLFEFYWLTNYTEYGTKQSKILSKGNKIEETSDMVEYKNAYYDVLVANKVASIRDSITLKFPHVKERLFNHELWIGMELEMIFYSLEYPTIVTNLGEPASVDYSHITRKGEIYYGSAVFRESTFSEDVIANDKVRGKTYYFEILKGKVTSFWEALY